MAHSRRGAQAPRIAGPGGVGGRLRCCASRGDLFGPNDSDDSVVDAMCAAVDAGINWIDTAESYGHGRSEELVGRAVRRRRGQVMVFTKVSPSNWGAGLRSDEVRAAAEGSLRRLQVDYLDLYQQHAVDPAVPLEETWAAMSRLVDDGLVRFVGLSNVAAEAVERAARLQHVDCVQNEFSLAYQEDRRQFLPKLRECGTGYLAYGPLAYGLLAGAITAATVFDPGDWRGAHSGGQIWRRLYAPKALPTWLARVDQARPIAERLWMPIGTLALAWVLAQPGVTRVIAGSRDARHVHANAAAGSVTVGAAALAELDAIFRSRATGARASPDNSPYSSPSHPVS